MKSLSEIALSYFALMEAEGRLMRAKAIITGGAIASIFIAGLFFFAACVMVAVATHIYLSEIYGEIIASLVVAAGFALVSVLLVCHGISKR